MTVSTSGIPSRLQLLCGMSFSLLMDSTPIAKFSEVHISLVDPETGYPE
jgi:hypothetical protein